MSWRSTLRGLLGATSVRAIRGATAVDDDSPDAIEAAVTELLQELQRENRFTLDEVVSAIFTVTPDLVSSFPAAAARSAGWSAVPMLCTTEIPVPDGLPRCLRIMLHVERDWSAPVRHVYLRDAIGLRPDLTRERQPALL